MRIGILTHFHKSTNYGGVLQAYALCKHLNNCGHFTQQILYIHNATKLGKSEVTLRKIIKKVCLRIKKRIDGKANKNIKNRMEKLFFEFRDSVPHTKQIYTKDNINEVSNDFDVFITGSDQVWNPKWFDSAYMLDFVQSDIPKISYAASIGVGFLDDDEEKIFVKYLSDFKNISVREKNAAESISKLIDNNVVVSVDPTLLLSVSEWDEIASDRIIEERYVFVYMLGENLHTRKLAKRFAEKNNLKLVIIPDLLGAYRRVDRIVNGQFIKNATPKDFISLIKYADCVFTDSFHACVFSLLYQREFFVFKRDGSMRMESRINHLTDLFDCTERFCNIKNKQTLEYLMSIKSRGAMKTTEKFLKEKEKSIRYLEGCLNES